MSKKPRIKKSHLSLQERQIGKKHVYLLLGMILTGLAIAFYNMR